MVREYSRVFLQVVNFFMVMSFFCYTGCQKKESYTFKSPEQKKVQSEYICREHDQFLFKIEDPKLQNWKKYSWEEGQISYFPKITKEFFRCKGRSSNIPRRIGISNNKEEVFNDCEGSSKHGLCLIHGKEGIYPVLLDILNYIQKITGKKVVITCGHRCPTHNNYADFSKENRLSKHMIGAEVDFYVQDLEEEPMQVIEHIFQYYVDHPKYSKNKEFTQFSRYFNEDTNVSIPPFYNKEVFIKLFQKDEGRDFDNRHPYPYISIQVRYDTERKERVFYTWEKAHQGYLRW